MIRHWDREAGDIRTRGSRQFLTVQDSTAHGIYHRLRMFFGEHFLDIADGTPWLQTILGKSDPQTAEAAIKQRIITAPGVVAITSFRFDSDRNTRRITVDCTVLDVNNEAVRILFDEDVI